MLLRHYINDGVTNVLAVTFFTLALLSFGYAEYFDRLFIAFLFGLFVLNKNNANIISIVVIFLFERLFEEVIFWGSTYPIVKPLIYLLSLSLLRILWYDANVKRFVFPVILICLSCEFFWYATSYNAPRIHSYLAMLMLNMATRHLIFLRVPLFKRYQSMPLINKHIAIPLKQISLDWQLYSLAMVNGAVVIVLIGEYLIRHLTHFSPLLVYEFYPYVMQLLAVATLFFITRFIVKSKHKISA